MNSSLGESGETKTEEWAPICSHPYMQKINANAKKKLYIFLHIFI